MQAHIRPKQSPFEILETHRKTKQGPYYHGVYRHAEDSYENAINKQIRTISDSAKWYAENSSLVILL